MRISVIFFVISITRTNNEITELFTTIDSTSITNLNETEPTSWMVRITHGIETARKIAQKEGFRKLKEISRLKLYHFHDLDPNVNSNEPISVRLSRYEEISWKRSTKEDHLPRADEYLPSLHDKILTSDDLIQFFPQVQIVRTTSYVDGSVLPHINDVPELQNSPTVFCAGPMSFKYKTIKPLYFNDPLYPNQWYLRSCQEYEDDKPAYSDIKVIQAWERYNVYGRGVIVIVLDEGVPIDHEDLDVDLNFSYNYYTNKPNPSPLPGESHGIATAGVVAMKANNRICGVGIAPLATIGALKVRQFGQGNEGVQADSFLFKAPRVHIMVRSLGDYKDHFMRSIREDFHSALHEGTKHGRGGKGILYVFAGGNSKNKADGTVCSGRPLVNSIYSITIGGVHFTGKPSTFAERCANIMAVMYSGDGWPFSIYSLGLGANDACDEKYGGTSASTPLATGALALVLEANPNLTWRDVQHIIAWSSEIAPFRQTYFHKNRAGFYVSLDFGFGLMNAHDMVELAYKFRSSVPPMVGCSTDFKKSISGMIPISRNRPARIDIWTSGCEGQTTRVNFIESVLVTIHLDYSKRGDLQILLTSPGGTPVYLLEARPDDVSHRGIDNFTFQSLHTWGENPKGQWTLEIFDNTGSASNKGQINRVDMIIYGTRSKPHLYEDGPRKYFPFSLEKINTV